MVGFADSYVLLTGRPICLRRTHGDVNVLEDLAALDAAAAVGGLDQIVTRLAAVFPPECIHEHQRFGQWFGFDEKTGAIDLPWCGRIPHIVHPFGGGRRFSVG